MELEQVNECAMEHFATQSAQIWPAVEASSHIPS